MKAEKLQKHRKLWWEMVLTWLLKTWDELKCTCVVLKYKITQIKNLKITLA